MLWHSGVQDSIVPGIPAGFGRLVLSPVGLDGTRCFASQPYEEVSAVFVGSTFYSDVRGSMALAPLHVFKLGVHINHL